MTTRELIHFLLSHENQYPDDEIVVRCEHSSNNGHPIDWIRFRHSYEFPRTVITSDQRTDKALS